MRMARLLLVLAALAPALAACVLNDANVRGIPPKVGGVLGPTVPPAAP